MAKNRYDPKVITNLRKQHRKIPTDVAMADDGRELHARNMADQMMMRGNSAVAAGQLGGNLKDKSPKKPLKDYSQFGMNNARRMEPGDWDDTSDAARNAQWSRSQANVQNNLANQRWEDYQPAGIVGGRVDADYFADKSKIKENIQNMFGGGGSSQAPPPPDTGSNIDGGAIEQELSDWWLNSMDPEARERRIDRARASQEAMVRATMGAGEAGRSGAAALLEGEAGRMAEQKQRVAELEREFGIQNLGITLAGYDLDAERYDEQMQMAIGMAAITMMEAVEADTAKELIEAMGANWDNLSPQTQAALESLVANWPSDDDGDGDGDGDADSETRYDSDTEDAEEEQDWTWLEDILVGPFLPMAGDIYGGLARGEIHDFDSFWDALGWSAENTWMVWAAKAMWDKIMTAPENR